jgi:CRP-like cAMP-binding protein
MTPQDILKPIHEWRADLSAIFAAEGVLRSYRRHAYVFLQGEQAVAAYAVKSGRIEIFSVSAQGREVSISIRGPGEIFGNNELVLGLDRVRGVRALEDSELWVLESEHFFELLCSRQDFVMALFTCALDRGIHHVEMTSNLVGTTARHRIVASLDFLASRPRSSRTANSSARVRVTHEQLGRICGLTRQTVTSELARLEEEGLLQLESGSVILPDKLSLRQVIEPLT